MSETAPESSSSGNVFTRKIGPLPLWGWMGIGLLIAVGYYLYSKNQAATASTNSSGETPSATEQSLVPQFVNQTYVQSTPPAAPNVTATATSTSTVTQPAGTGGLSVTPYAKYLDIGDLIGGTSKYWIYEQPGNKLVASGTANNSSIRVTSNIMAGKTYYVKVLTNGKYYTKTVKTPSK